jgi:hypothetical protein
VGKRGVKAERYKPWKFCRLENDYVKAFACKTCSGIGTARATAHDKDLRVLLRVIVRHWKRDEEEKCGQTFGGRRDMDQRSFKLSFVFI